MSDINSVGASDVLSQFGRKPEETGNKSNELGQNEFLELMIAQMNNQSPLDPQDNAQFVAELAQFSSVENLTSLNETVSSFASQFRSSQALQASAMVGRDVMVAGDTTVKSATGGLAAIVDLPTATSDLKISVLDSAGALVYQDDMGQNLAGDVDFFWTGNSTEGEPLPAGRYKVVAEARYDGRMQQVDTYVSANVDSVSIAQDGGVTLNLAGLPSVGINEIKEIQ
jgi:flagellar basal-body rod modification protein FlgD